MTSKDFDKQGFRAMLISGFVSWRGGFLPGVVPIRQVISYFSEGVSHSLLVVATVIALQ
jgi:hypothetical protein